MDCSLLVFSSQTNVKLISTSKFIEVYFPEHSSKLVPEMNRTSNRICAT